MKRLSVIWLTLLGLTLAAWALGPRLEGMGAIALVLGLAGLKGQLVIDRFMELAHAPRLFRYAVSGWLVGVLALVALIGWIT